MAAENDLAEFRQNFSSFAIFSSKKSETAFKLCVWGEREVTLSPSTVAQGSVHLFLASQKWGSISLRNAAHEGLNITPTPLQASFEEYMSNREATNPRDNEERHSVRRQPLHGALPPALRASSYPSVFEQASLLKRARRVASPSGAAPAPDSPAGSPQHSSIQQMVDDDPSAEVEVAFAKLRKAYSAASAQVIAREETIRHLKEQIAAHQERQAILTTTHGDQENGASGAATAQTTQAAVTTTLALQSCAAGTSQSLKPRLQDTSQESWAVESAAHTPAQLAHLPWLSNWKELYPPPPIPADDAERCRIVDELFVLDTEEEELYNDLCALTRRMLNVQLVCIDIVARDRIWFKASSIDHPKMNGFKTAPRNLAPCNYVVKKGATLVIPDMHRQDPQALARHAGVSRAINCRTHRRYAL